MVMWVEIITNNMNWNFILKSKSIRNNISPFQKINIITKERKFDWFSKMIPTLNQGISCQMALQNIFHNYLTNQSMFYYYRLYLYIYFWENLSFTLYFKVTSDFYLLFVVTCNLINQFKISYSSFVGVIN